MTTATNWYYFTINNISSSNEDSKDEEDNDIIPGLQDCDQPDSSNDVDIYNTSDNEDFLDIESDNTYYQLPYDLTGMNSTITRDYDDDSDIPSRGRPILVPSSRWSLGASPRSVPRVMKTTSTVPSAVSSYESNKENRPSDAWSTNPILYNTSSPCND